MLLVWWLRCKLLLMTWSRQVAACQRLTSHSSHMIWGPTGVLSGSSCMSAPTRHHQPMRICVHMTGVQAFQHVVDRIEVATIAPPHGRMHEGNLFVEGAMASHWIWAVALV